MMLFYLYSLIVLSFWLTKSNAAVIGNTTIVAPKIKLFKKLDKDSVMYLIPLLLLFVFIIH